MSGTVGPSPVPTYLDAINVGTPTGTTAEGFINASGGFAINGVPITGALTPTNFAALDLSTLPTSDPGSGKPWLNGGVMQVGP
jgi:hypothetical protein